MAQSIFALPVPYLRFPDGGFQPGQTVFIKGFFLADRYSINLTTGSNVQGDNRDPIALHISVRSLQKLFVLNTLIDGVWGPEERFSLTVKPQEEFDIRIRAHEGHFEIYTNGKRSFNYSYRLPLTMINHIFIEGQVELYRVSWKGEYYSIPYDASIPPVMPGLSVTISGFIKTQAKQFSINLMCGYSYIFHFNPRFNQKAIVRNHKDGGSWGAEETDGGLPVKRGRTFDIIISCTDSGYDVFVNSKPFCSFTHRITPFSADTLMIDGDVTIHRINWEEW